ncbi:thiamine phosphate synthase [Helicobacter turcicus]|uniref:Thiamine phosphate synthase n=1 Tax=Helicobacter turcicus TaxID=2867412 RepID=A0ABS7JLR4_9HELI|nr:thiamine phosphate synthase [Helicobacter turcicus]MBX7490316.1 thiamine phosphate synthase [Helicobacter turcicus]MBX7545105.1 thiamine phosphate synthase [Helicobacter turcicus]
MLHGIYAISDTTLTPYSALENMLECAIRGGIALFQLRDKNTPDSTLAPLCAHLMKLCDAHNVIFVLNDRIELAKTLKSPALHIGKKEDGTPYNKDELTQIRLNYHGILGVSCYGDFNLAQNAALVGADYIAFGACFHSPTKPNAKTIPLNIFTRAKNLGLPMCAIGGIQKDNIAQIKDAQMVACISSIWQGDIKKNVQELLHRFKQGQ